MDIISLGSGSRGNATLVHIGGSYILIDNGFNLREITRRLPVDPKFISAILLTHEHSDHLEGVPALSREYSIPVYMPTALSEVTRAKTEGVEVVLKNDGESVIDGVKVTAFRVPHDAKYTVGYKLQKENESFASVTDLGEFTGAIFNNLKGTDTVLIESNYDEEMLRGGAYPPILKKRIEGRLGHLSNGNCAEAVVRLGESGTKRFILGHISENNNIPELAYARVMEALELSGKKLFVGVSAQDKVRIF